MTTKLLAVSTKVSNYGQAHKEPNKVVDQLNLINQKQVYTNTLMKQSCLEKQQHYGANKNNTELKNNTLETKGKIYQIAAQHPFELEQINKNLIILTDRVSEIEQNLQKMTTTKQKSSGFQIDIQKLTEHITSSVSNLTQYVNSLKQTNSQLEINLSDLNQKENYFTTLVNCYKDKVETLEAALNKEKQQEVSFTTKLKDVKDWAMDNQTKIINLQSSVLQSQKRVKFLERITFVGRCLSSLTELNQTSKVITSVNEAKTVDQFFEQKKVSFTQLLYRASEHGFSVPRFHQKCDNISNTLILCTTEFDKKIGGFTPLTWSSNQDGDFKEDESGESFIFSVTLADKFILTSKEKAICNHKGIGPIFGGGADFYICDNADQSDSGASINSSYQNQKYKQDDKAPWQSFGGNPNLENQIHFKVKEWEVWKVQFE